MKKKAIVKILKACGPIETDEKLESLYKAIFLQEEEDCRKLYKARSISTAQGAAPLLTEFAKRWNKLFEEYPDYSWLKGAVLNLIYKLEKEWITDNKKNKRGDLCNTIKRGILNCKGF